MQTTNRLNGETRSSLAPLGYMLAALSVLALVALLHHPVVHGGEPAAMLASMRSQSTVDQVVHATLVIVFGLLTTAMVLFSARLGFHRFIVSAGLVAFSCAFVMTLLAAMTDGFVIPAIVARCAPASAGSCVAEAFTLLRLCAIQIEFLTRFSFVAIAIAVAASSSALLFTEGTPRWAGLTGLASATAQLAALFAAANQLTPPSLLVIFAAQVIWYLLAAALMIWQRGPFVVTARASKRSDQAPAIS